MSTLFSYIIDPAPHPTEPDMMVVPLFKQRPNDYALYITGTTARYYTDIELPDVLRSQLAMIHAMHQQPIEAKNPRGGGLSTQILRKYAALDVPVGVWLAPSWYLLVLENNVLKELAYPTQTV
jgi:hypothetical protein